jgi:hypothetical protein
MSRSRCRLTRGLCGWTMESRMRLDDFGKRD